MIGTTDDLSKAEREYNEWLTKWEGPPNPGDGQTTDGYYLEIAGFLIGALRDLTDELRAQVEGDAEEVETLRRDVADLSRTVSRQGHQLDRIIGFLTSPMEDPR